MDKEGVKSAVHIVKKMLKKKMPKSVDTVAAETKSQKVHPLTLLRPYFYFGNLKCCNRNSFKRHIEKLLTPAKMLQILHAALGLHVITYLPYFPMHLLDYHLFLMVLFQVPSKLKKSMIARSISMYICCPDTTNVPQEGPS